MKTITEFSNKCLHEMNFGELSTTECVAKYLDLWHKEQVKWIRDRFPKNNEKVIFLVRGNDMRMGVFLESDQWGRKNMFCDGAFHKPEYVDCWVHTPSIEVK